MTNQELIPKETIEKTVYRDDKEFTPLCAAIRNAESGLKVMELDLWQELVESGPVSNAQQKRIDKALGALKERLEKEKFAREVIAASKKVKVEASVRWHMTNPFSKWNGTEEECRQAMLKNIK
jgi:hypothetical protein